jgi:hypothetical protein
MDDLHASNLYVPVTPMKGMPNTPQHPSKDETLPPHPATPSQPPAAAHVGIAEMTRGGSHSTSNTTPVISIVPIHTANDDVVSVTSVATGGESSAATTPTNKAANKAATATPKTTTKRNVTVEENPPTLHAQTPQKATATGAPGTEKKGKGPGGNGDGTSGLGMSSLDMSAISKVYEDEQDQQHYLSKFSILRPDITTIQTATGTTPHHTRPQASTPHHPTIMEEEEEDEEEKAGDGKKNTTLRNIAQRMLNEASRNSSFISDSSESMNSMTAVHNGRTAGNTVVGSKPADEMPSSATNSTGNQSSSTDGKSAQDLSSTGGGWKTASGGSGKKDIYHRSPTRNPEAMVDITTDTIVTIHPNMVSAATTPYKDASSTQAHHGSAAPIVVVLEEEGRPSTPPVPTTSSAGTLSSRGDDSSTSPNSSMKKRTLKTIKVMSSPTNSSPGHGSHHSPQSRSTLGHRSSEGGHASTSSLSPSSSQRHHSNDHANENNNTSSPSSGSHGPGTAKKAAQAKNLSIQTQYGVNDSDSEGSIPPYGMIIPVSSEPQEKVYVSHSPRSHLQQSTHPQEHHDGDAIARAKEEFKRSLAIEKQKYDQEHQQNVSREKGSINYRPPLQLDERDENQSVNIPPQDMPHFKTNTAAYHPTSSNTATQPSVVYPNIPPRGNGDEFSVQLSAVQSLLQTTQQQVQSLQHTLHQQDTTYQQSLFSYQVQILSLQDEKERLLHELTALKCDFAQLKTKQVVNSLKTNTHPSKDSSNTLEGKSQREVMQLYLHQQSLIALLQEENALRKKQVEQLQGQYTELSKDWEEIMAEKVWYEHAYHTALAGKPASSYPKKKTVTIDKGLNKEEAGEFREDTTMLAHTPIATAHSDKSKKQQHHRQKETSHEEEEDANASRLVSPTLPSPLRAGFTSAEGASATSPMAARAISIEEVEEIPTTRTSQPIILSQTPIISATTNPIESTSFNSSNDSKSATNPLEIPLFKRYQPSNLVPPTSSSAAETENGILDTDIQILNELIQKQSQR